MKTGYFGRATENEHRALSTKVHVIDNSGKTLCRYKPHKTMRFHFCSSGINMLYITCKKCQDKIYRGSRI